MSALNPLRSVKPRALGTILAYYKHKTANKTNTPKDLLQDNLSCKFLSRTSTPALVLRTKKLLQETSQARIEKFDDSLPQTQTQAKCRVQDTIEHKINLDLSRKPPAEYKKILASTKQLCFAGGGAAGSALVDAILTAIEYGLDLDKVKVICATSVGTLLGLVLTIKVPPQELKQTLLEMPRKEFLDWDLNSILDFYHNWGFCKGDVMEGYFRDLIRKYTGLENPTFYQLYQHGFDKEFRVLVTNISQNRAEVFSYKNTPHVKVAEAVVMSCRIPIVFRPKFHKNKDNNFDAYVDGGIMKNYPWGVETQKDMPLDEQLGFIFVNKSVSESLNLGVTKVIANLWQFSASLLNNLLFQESLCLDERVMSRTVAIEVSQNPLRFEPTEAEQEKLDHAGRTAVYKLVNKLVKQKEALRLQANIRPKKLQSQVDLLKSAARNSKSNTRFKK